MWATLLTRMMQVLRRLLSHLAAWEQRASAGKQNDARQRKMVLRTSGYDMIDAVDEAFYADQYLHWLNLAIATARLPANTECLELGCGHGRLALRLAERFPQGHVTGVDISSLSLAAAQRHAQERGLKNVSWAEADIETCLPSHPLHSCDLILMAEVTFFFPQWQKILPDALRVLRPGGLLAVAFRPLYYDALNLVRLRLWNQIPTLLSHTEGRIYDNDTVFSWQEAANIRRLFTEEMHLELLHLVGIGCCSGIPYDAHNLIAQPSQLAPDEQRALKELELGLAARLPDTGRYMLAIGRKPAS
jgi:ubiquinone/menaquinone biosynthesis C-methylase UbiE